MAFTAHDPKLRIVAIHQRMLLAEAGLHGDPLSAFGAPARDHGLPAFGLHTRPESMRLRAMTAVRLKCALRHEKMAAPNSFLLAEK
jgi:hypothetical protein